MRAAALELLLLAQPILHIRSAGLRVAAGRTHLSSCALSLSLSPAAKYDTVICIKLNGYDSGRGARAQDDNEMTRNIAKQTPTAWLTSTQISTLIACETF
jgi:hypothetical protein